MTNEEYDIFIPEKNLRFWELTFAVIWIRRISKVESFLVFVGPEKNEVLWFSQTAKQ